MSDTSIKLTLDAVMIGLNMYFWHRTCHTIKCIVQYVNKRFNAKEGGATSV